MKMDKNGQVPIVGIMVTVMVFIVLLQLITPMKEILQVAIGTDGLDCTDATLTTGVKATCVIVDSTLFYFFGVAMFSAISGILAKKSFGDKQQ